MAWVVVLVFWLCSLCLLFAGLLVFFLLLLCARLHFELADLLLSIFFLRCDLGCWCWVGAVAGLSCCLCVVLLGLSFVFWCQSAFLSWIVLVFAAPHIFPVLCCFCVLCVCVCVCVCVGAGVTLSSCCFGGCACVLVVCSVSECLLACLSSFCCWLDVCTFNLQPCFCQIFPLV